MAKNTLPAWVEEMGLEVETPKVESKYSNMEYELAVAKTLDNRGTVLEIENHLSEELKQSPFKGLKLK